MKKVGLRASLGVLRCHTPAGAGNALLADALLLARRTYKETPAMKALIDIDPTTAVGPRIQTVWSWGGGIA